MNNEIKTAIENCVNIYYKEETDENEKQAFLDNLGETLHENLATNGFHAKDANEFKTWEGFARELVNKN